MDAVTYADFLFDGLKRQLNLQRKKVQKLEEITGDKSTLAFPTVAEADLPYAADGMNSFECRFVSDGLKVGESPAGGTGCPAYYDPTSDTWKRFGDDTTVAT